jgi:NitT/TauT family transport system substrate-binding protein
MAQFARLILALLLFAGLTVSTRADTGEVRITRQPGLLYLPMILMEAHQLIEKNAKASGLGDLNVSWLTFNSGGAATDVLLTGSVDFVTTGATNMLLLWDRT